MFRELVSDNSESYSSGLRFPRLLGHNTAVSSETPFVSDGFYTLYLNLAYRAFHHHKPNVMNEKRRAERTRLTPCMTSPMLESTIKPTRSNEIRRANEEIDSGVNPNTHGDCSFGMSSERVAGDKARLI
jgi:hypothetical protein